MAEQITVVTGVMFWEPGDRVRTWDGRRAIVKRAEGETLTVAWRDAWYWRLAWWLEDDWYMTRRHFREAWRHFIDALPKRKEDGNDLPF